MPSTVLCTGFEAGSIAGASSGTSGSKLADSSAGTGTVVSTSPRSGTYCLELSGTAAAANLKWDANTLGSSKTAVVATVGVYFPTSLPSADLDLITVELSTGGFDIQVIFQQSTGKIVAVDGANSVVGPVVSANTWYRIDLRVDVSGANTIVDMAVDGTTYTQASTSNTGTSIFSFALGRLGAQTGTVRYDDVVVSVTAADYPLGNHKVLLVKPDTGGTTTEIGTANATARFTSNGTLDTTHNSANILAALSEVPPTIGATASGVHQRTSGVGNAVGVPMTTYTLAAGESVSGLRVLIAGWAASSTANNIEVRAYNGSTETTLFPKADPAFDNSTTAPTWIAKMYAGVTDQTTLDALVVRLGYSDDVSPVPGAHAIYGEVAVGVSAVSASLPPLPAARRLRHLTVR
jgi:hypothetical protein